MDSLSEVTGPSSNTILKDGIPYQIHEVAPADWLLKRELEEALLDEFRTQIGTGRWGVRAMPRGKSDRETIAVELVEDAAKIDFEDNKIGPFSLVEITETPATDRYLIIKWFIEQVCSVVPPKQGVKKHQIPDLADRLLPFDVRDDIFKAAWADAKIPEGFRKSGR
ncbi:MAG: hypothetical protein AAF127_15860 [Pseudomonadota bacterium]